MIVERIEKMSLTSCVNVKSVDEKIQLITRDLEEVIGLEKLQPILGERNLKLYWGTATTGKPHIAYFVPLLKIADFLAADCEVTILLADLHAYLDNLKAPWELLEHRTNYYKELISAMLESIGVPLSKLKFVRGTEYQLNRQYVLDMYRMSTLSTLHDCRKAGSDVVKQLQHPHLSGFIYPGLQALDEQYLDVDAQFGGVDQRKIFTFAEKLLPQLGYKKRIHLMNAMVAGLSGGKMSSSEPDSKIDILDSFNDLKRKINKAFCEEGNIVENGVLNICKHIIFPFMMRLDDQFIFSVERKAEHGGDLELKSFQELIDLFQNKQLHPGDLKKSTVSYLDKILGPIRARFHTPQLLNLVSLAYPSTKAENEAISSKFCFVVGQIKTIFQHPECENVTVFKISIGANKSVLICDGSIRWNIDSLISQKVVVLKNVSPVKLGSISNDACFLTIKFQQLSESIPSFALISPPSDCEVGEIVLLGSSSTNKTPKLKLSDPAFVEFPENLHINDEMEIEFNNNTMMTLHGAVKSDRMSGSLHFNSF